MFRPVTCARPLEKRLKKPFPGFFQPRKRKTQFSASIIFDGLKSLKMEKHPSAARKLSKNRGFQKPIQWTLATLITWSVTAGAWNLSGDLRVALEKYPDLSDHSLASRARGRLALDHETKDLALHCEGRFSQAHRPLGSDSRVEMDECYIAWQGESLGLRIGRQQVAWGRADGFRLLDRVNPWRIPDLIYDDAADARRSLWMVLAEGDLNAVQWQAFGGYDRRRDQRSPGFDPFQQDGELPRAVGFGGLHLETFVQQLAVGLYWLDQPDLRLPMPGVSDHLRREQALGVSADLPTGPLVWRGETMLIRRHEPRNDVTWKPKNRVAALLGIDWQPGDWLLSAQLYRYPGPPSTIYGSLLARWSHFQDRLEIKLFAAHQLAGQETWISVQAGFLVGEHLEIRLEGDWFHAPIETSGLFGPLSRATRLGGELVIRF